MNKYIYKITSPSNKVYIGLSTIPVEDKANLYKKSEIYENSSSRKIIKAINKYNWKNMVFEVIDQNDSWTYEELTEREKYWISYFDSFNSGYNMTAGGDGVDSTSAKQYALVHHSTMTEQKKEQRKKNCSAGQLQRYKENSDSDITKKRKSDAHKGVYRIESPDGKVWETDIGLKDFAEQHKDELNVDYWGLFNAYRKCYNNTVVVRKRKDSNNWKVTRLDKPNN
jgi:hypothetical protein